MESKLIEYEKDKLKFLGKRDCTVEFLNYLIKEKSWVSDLQFYFKNNKIVKK